MDITRLREYRVRGQKLPLLPPPPLLAAPPPASATVRATSATARFVACSVWSPLLQAVSYTHLTLPTILLV